MKDRITLLIKAKNLTAAQFADEIGVQKSSISHIISGRNNASLDFIQKILLCFPEVSMDWLMFGKGPIFKSIETSVNGNIDGRLNAVQPPVLPHVDLFSDLSPAKGVDFLKENDLSEEQDQVENSKSETVENEIVLPLKEERDIKMDNLKGYTENRIDSSGNKKNSTKITLKIVEFYSDNTYREYFPE